MNRPNVDRARGPRASRTEAGQRLGHHLRNHRLQGWKLRRQHEISRYITHLACPDAGLVVALDGCQHGEQAAYDQVRTRTLESMGYRVLRFWDNDVLTNIEGVLEVILEARESPAPHPDLFLAPRSRDIRVPSPRPGGERRHTAETDE